MTGHPRPLEIGSISLRLYPHDVPAREQLDLIRAQARAGVEAGFDGIMVSEHHADFPGYLPNPIQIAGFLLPAMPRGWAAACPLLLPMQPYALVAEQIAWLNAAYPGRVGAGFAAGALPVDFELAEVPFDEIRERFKTALPLVVDALQGRDQTPLGRDRALRDCADEPVPMVVAAQSPAAVRRAARLGLGILYDSLQTVEATRRLSDIYDEAGGTGPKLLIRRVWIGEPPRAEIEAQMQHYRSYAPEAAMKNWGDGNSLVHGDTAEAAAEALASVLNDTNCDTINIRIHVKGLTPQQIDDQIGLHASGFLPHLRKVWSSGA